jgi:integrase/recombinase XerD
MTALPPLLQAFFTERLAHQRDASPHTIASYRDSFRLLLTFLNEQTGKAPSKLQLQDSIRPESPRSSAIWRTNGATASGHATRA